MFLGPEKMAWLAVSFYANDVINARIKEVRITLACPLMVIGRFCVDSFSVGGMLMCKCQREYR